MYDCLKTLSLPVLMFIPIPDKILKHLCFLQGAILTTMLVSRNFSGECFISFRQTSETCA